jgi:hypothetical protein
MEEITPRIRKGFAIVGIIFACGVFSPGSALAVVGPALKAGVAYLDETLEAASKISGRSLSPAYRKIALAQLRNAVAKHGDEAIVAARKGGLELMEVAGKYGDDVWTLASKTPAGARALAMRPQELLPMTRRIGAEVLELEAKSPGLAKHVVKNFGDDGVRHFAGHVPANDATRLVGYANRADNPATRDLLIEAYKKGGADFLDKLNWKHIMATGLSVAAITAAYQVSDGVQEGLITVSEDSPETFHQTSSLAIDRLTAPVVVPAMVLGLGVVCIWLFRYYRKTREKWAKSHPSHSGMRVRTFCTQSREGCRMSMISNPFFRPGGFWAGLWEILVLLGALQMIFSYSVAPLIGPVWDGAPCSGRFLMVSGAGMLVAGAVGLICQWRRRRWPPPIAPDELSKKSKLWKTGRAIDDC